MDGNKYRFSLYGAEAVAYFVLGLYQSLSEEMAMALHFLLSTYRPSHKEMPKTLSKSRQTNNKSIMAYLFRCTAKQSVCGGKVPKGVTVQVVMHTDMKPQTADIRAAIKQQLGIETKESFGPSYFNIEKIK